ncbi:MAG TPA: RES domain-containing protein [Geobacteraceae bacterium]|nr:RES domain-containing protein [Geobacteraceae bacterium]
MYLYRIATAAFADDLSGRGAELYGGRWNPPGLRALYVADSASQALLEFLPHFPETVRPPDLMLVAIEAPDTLSIKEILQADLPPNWDTRPPEMGTILFGREWLIEGTTVALRAPSVLLPYGKAWNMVLNPRHPDYTALRVNEIIPLPIDPRLGEKLRKPP